MKKIIRAHVSNIQTTDKLTQPFQQKKIEEKPCRISETNKKQPAITSPVSPASQKEEAIAPENCCEKNITKKEALKILFQKKKRETNETPKNSFVLKLTTLTILFAFMFGLVGAYIYNMFIAETIAPTKNTTVSINVVEKVDAPKLEDLDHATIPYVAAKVQNSVVAITTNSLSSNSVMGQYIQEGAGSGVIISEDGYIITNTHVLSRASSVSVMLFDNKEYPASIIAADVTSDIAVIKIDVTGLTPITFGDSDSLIVGQTVVAIGNPLGELGGTVTSGIISAKDRELTINSQNMNLLQFSAAVNPGNSGGGLFNLNGELVGIVNAKNSNVGIEGLGFAIPVNDAQNVAKQLIENGKVTGRPQLGISVVEIKNMSEIHQYMSEPIYPYLETTGIYVTSSNNGHLLLGDKIIAIDGQSISTFEDFKNYINKKKVGDTVKITVSRNKQIVNVEMNLMEKS